MLIPPPVKFSAFVAVSFEAMPQLGALMFGLPWKLIEPVNAKTHGGFGNVLTWAMACRAYVDSGQTKHFCQVRWLLLANSRLNEISVDPVHAVSVSIWTVCEVPVGRLVAHWEPG